MVLTSTSPTTSVELLLLQDDQMNDVKYETRSSSSSRPAECSWMDNLGIPIFSVDAADGRVLYWNKRLKELTGLDHDHVHGRIVCDLLHSNSRPPWEKALAEVLLPPDGSSSSSSSCELSLQCRENGKMMRFRARLTKQTSSIGTVDAVCFLEEEEQLINGGFVVSAEATSVAPLASSSRPISPTLQLRKAETMLETDQITLDVKSVFLPAFLVDMQGVVRNWSRQMEAMTGYKLDDVVADGLSKLFSKQDLDKFENMVADSLLGEESSVVVNLCGREKAQRVKLSSAVQSSGGLNVGVAVLVNEVVEESNGLLDDSGLFVFGLDTQGIVDMCNAAAARLTGYRVEETIGKDFATCFTEGIHLSSTRAVVQSAICGATTANHKLEMLSKGGETRYLVANFSARRDATGAISGCLVVAQDVTETAQYDRSVTAMAQELRQLLNTANAPIFGVDREGNVNEWNDKMVEITGYSGDDAFGLPFVDTYIAAEYRGSVHNLVGTALKGRGTTNYELEITTKSNDTRFLLLNATTRRDADNNIVGMIGIAQDVTEAAKHDRAVAAMANELRQLIDTANAPIFGIDCDGDVNEWNDKTAEITGYTKEEAFDCSLVETFIVPSMQESVQEVLDGALEGRGTSNYELEFRTKSNEVRHLLLNVTTRRDTENNVVGVVGVAQDVTEAVQRDRAVAGMALELRQLIDTANAPIFGIDIDGNVNEWNRRTQEITGYSKEETFDEPLVERFIAKSMRKKVHEILDSALRGNETSNYELEFISKSGEPRFLLVNATTRRDPEFNVVGVVGVAQDVTEDRKHAAELRRMQYLQATQEAKVETERNMTAYFAHELRNPLSAIDSALSAMPDDLPKSAKTLVSGMQLCSSFMSSIMNNLLDVRKMEEGKMTLNVRPLSLDHLVNGVYKMLAPSVKPGVAFLKNVDVAGKDWVLGDEHRIQQVLTNVVTNAIKYTVSGSISLNLRWDGDKVVFECVDTGPGIPKGEQEKLFERFVQRGGAPGTGLGLAIAKHLVDLTGGSIRFDSDPKVKAGTTCVVIMPLTLCDRPEDTKEEEDASLLEQPLRFLIIDDVKMNRMMLKRRIKKGICPNAMISEACTGEEALELCGHEEFDIIVVDQYMEEAGGVMVGTDVVYAMRRMRIDAIIIGCSGNDLDEEFKEAGADWCWKKPMPSNGQIIAHLKLMLADGRKASTADMNDSAHSDSPVVEG